MGEYPVSDVEFSYLLIGYNRLDEKQKNIITEKIKEIKIKKTNCKDETFTYECPLLIDKKCSLYEYRGIICRTHGLLYFIKEDNGGSRQKIPRCVNLGLNYSKVYDSYKKMITDDLWEKSKIATAPVAYDLSLKSLLSNDLAKELNLNFKEVRPLIDWF